MKRLLLSGQGGGEKTSEETATAFTVSKLAMTGEQSLQIQESKSKRMWLEPYKSCWFSSR